MKNPEIAKLLRMMAIYLDMKEIKFKPQAYERAAYSVEALDEDIEEFIKKRGKEGLKNLPGVGESIAEKIIEYLKTGKIKELEELKKEVPVDVETLTSIEGVGPKIVYKLYKALEIKTIDDLEKACREHKIRRLPGFGEKSEEKILKGIEFFKQGGGRAILGFIIPVVEELVNYLKESGLAKEVMPAGSYRRKKETIGDIDILAVSDKPKKLMDYFVKFPEVNNIYAQGLTKTMVRLKIGLDADLRVVSEENFGAALAYFTGSKDHNIKMRELAIKKGWKLNEYGLFDKNEKMIAGRTEEEIYEKLGLDWIPPEMREDRGEIELAMEGRLPKLIEYGSIKGDLQVQTNWTDGQNSIKEMIEEAIKLGLEYICITDHTKSLAMTGGLDEEKLLKQMAEIDKLNQKYKGKIKILKGAEVNILKDGGLDIKDEVLAKLDFVGAAVHSHFNLPRNIQTERIKKAMTNPNVDCIFHPTGRIINKRPAYEINIDEIIDYAKKTNTILEIDAYPDRLDLKDEHIRKCVEKGVKMIINTDAHSVLHLSFLDLGVSQARRGWANKNDILNTLTFKKFLQQLKKNK
ncbi:MAG: DNA polymerase/3'-5' exonuclease PolX [Candidatus Parcubacteria bacterium]|nr:MAG: DNA polymerase/3'-5' exonuclease PolX [Candidatus Parcubacteria bacterium]